MYYVRCENIPQPEAMNPTGNTRPIRAARKLQAVLFTNVNFRPVLGRGGGVAPSEMGERQYKVTLDEVWSEINGFY